MCELSGTLGTLATNSISQADSREVGLDQLLEAGWLFHRAVKSAPWPGAAGVEIAKLWLTRPPWSGSIVLDGRPVKGISSLLDVKRRIRGKPFKLVRSSRQSFIGCALNTTNFILNKTEAAELLASAPSEAAVIRPYLSGSDLNTYPDHRASRWVIDFADWSEEKARRFPRSWQFAEERVKPIVLKKTGYKGWSDRWWQFWNPRPALRSALEGLDRMITIARVSKHLVPALVKSNQVPSEQVVVFALDDYGCFGLLSSAAHWSWAHTWCSTIRSSGLRYSPTDAFETFPLPLAGIGGSLSNEPERNYIHTARS